MASAISLAVVTPAAITQNGRIAQRSQSFGVHRLEDGRPVDQDKIVGLRIAVEHGAGAGRFGQAGLGAADQDRELLEAGGFRPGRWTTVVTASPPGPCGTEDEAGTAFRHSPADLRQERGTVRKRVRQPGAVPCTRSSEGPRPKASAALSMRPRRPSVRCD